MSLSVDRKILREVPVCAFMIHSEGSYVRVLSFRVDSGVASENSQRTDGDLRVLHEQHFVGYDWSVISITKCHCCMIWRLGVCL